MLGETIMWNYRKHASAAGIFAALACSTAANAATQGSLGATSTGTVGISATIPARVQITGLSDFGFGSIEPGAAASTSNPRSSIPPLCVCPC